VPSQTPGNLEKKCCWAESEEKQLRKRQKNKGPRNCKNQQFIQKIALRCSKSCNKVFKKLQWRGREVAIRCSKKYNEANPAETVVSIVFFHFPSYENGLPASKKSQWNVRKITRRCSKSSDEAFLHRIPMMAWGVQTIAMRRFETSH